MPATEDWLHQQYRQPSMPETLQHIVALRAENHAAVVSGAGPTLCVFAANAAESATVTTEATGARSEIFAALGRADSAYCH